MYKKFSSLISKSKLYFTGHLRDASKILEKQSSEITNKINYYSELRKITENCLLKIKGELTENYLNKIILKGWELKKKNSLTS